MSNDTTTEHRDLTIDEMKEAAAASEKRLAERLAQTRAERDQLNDMIRDLVAEHEEAARINRLLNRKSRS